MAVASSEARERVTSWTEAWDEIGAEVTETIPVGERHIVTAIHQAGRGRSGIEVTMDAAFLFEVGDDGLISYLALLPTSEEALALARARAWRLGQAVTHRPG